MTMRHKLIDSIPVVEDMEDGVLYVSMKYAIVSHRCCCGCGQEVVTPISPADWRLTFHGKTFSLFPSIGNWSFPCRSHYWIRENEVIWDRECTSAKFLSWRSEDDRSKSSSLGRQSPPPKIKKSLFSRVKGLIFGGR